MRRHYHPVSKQAGGKLAASWRQAGGEKVRLRYVIWERPGWRGAVVCAPSWPSTWRWKSSREPVTVSDSCNEGRGSYAFTALIIIGASFRSPRLPAPLRLCGYCPVRARRHVLGASLCGRLYL
jgi:hypothetical protein